MTIQEAIEFIRPAIDRTGRWADLGAGRGTFTLALAELLGAGHTVVAVDRDPSAVAALRTLALQDTTGCSILPARGDLTGLEAVSRLREQPLDGVLIANALHFLPDATAPLVALRDMLKSGGRIVVIEYDRGTANRWVPHPLRPEDLRRTLERAGFSGFDVVASRPSAYQGSMYCAVATVDSARG